ncbi:UbiA family prenyltransferase [Streptomyces wuyuanensis]|uniref:UbiA family prenyltransferase n=1 Tax=Streptomyces wuyuanensis TaxID=1196353 RepID=UPI00341DEF2D
MVDDVLAALLPAVLFTAVACVHYGIDAVGTTLHVATSVVLFSLYLYVFNASNQARSVTEDMANKPYRPVPRGLISPTGAMRRFWCAMAIYTLLGWLTGTLIWVVLWQTVVIGLNLWSLPRHYWVLKPVAMGLGLVVQLAAAWQIVAPPNTVIWSWVLTIAVAFVLPMPFEDVRDMDGDRQIGRRTLPLSVGHWPVRIGFAVTMTALPLALYLLLFRFSHASPITIAACTAVVVIASWSAVIRSLLFRTAPADRATYLIYTFTYCVVISCGLVLF